jgi:hypothetical protein
MRNYKWQPFSPKKAVLAICATPPQKAVLAICATSPQKAVLAICANSPKKSVLAICATSPKKSVLAICATSPTNVQAVRAHANPVIIEQASMVVKPQIDQDRAEYDDDRTITSSPFEYDEDMYEDEGSNSETLSSFAILKAKINKSSSKSKNSPLRPI